jgi:flagellin
MSTVINTNMKSMIAANALKVNGRAMSSAMEQLSTGSRINSASDDAAGLAISQDMGAQIRSLNMAVRNANDGISMAQTAEGALIEVSEMLQRMRELAIQASTGTLSTDQSKYLDAEYKALSDQIGDTITNTKWNNIAVLSEANIKTTGITVQVGADKSQSITIKGDTLEDVASAKTYESEKIDLTNATRAASALDAVDKALGQVNAARAGLGAVVNRLTSAADNLTNISQNLSASRSRVLDTDYATATTDLARTMIIQQAGTAVLAQANQSSQSVLALLR